MALYELDGAAPQLAADGQCWVAPSAVLIGNVMVARDASVWWGSVVRADSERIEIGEGSNIQDNCTMHTDPGFVLKVGRGVTVGHMAMVHGCTLHDNVLVGMGVMAGGLGFASRAVDTFKTKPDERPAARDDIRKGNAIAIAGAAAGGVLLVGGAVLLGLGLRRRGTVERSLAAGPGQIGLSWRIRF